MYEKYFGLKEKPFSLTPDPEFLFENEHFRLAFDNIIYGIKRHEGFATIVGDVGTGKTTFCWALLGRLDQNIRTALILNPMLTGEDMLKAILQDFGVRPAGQEIAPPAGTETPTPYDSSWMEGKTKKELIDQLNLFLLQGAEQDIFNILIIDEAQNLSLELLEQLRILSNLETAKKKLLQIIFVGQLEFEEKLHLPQLRQLNQRITIRYALEPLSKKDTVQYIEHRLSVAGSRRSVGFTTRALQGIHAHSKGYPRLINVICDRSLLAGYTEHTRLITSRIVRKAARGLNGEERGRRIRYVGSKKVLVPLAVLLLLALMAAVYFWAWGGTLAVLKADLTKAPPQVSMAASTPSQQDASAETALPPAPSPVPPVTVLRPPDPAPASGAQPVLAPGAGEEAPRYLLQLHSLESRGEADAALTSLQKNGYAAFVKMQETQDGARWYAVYAGPYESAERARQDAARLMQQKIAKPILRRMVVPPAGCD